MTSRFFLLLLALAFVLLRLPSLFEPNWYGDEAIYLTLGWLQRLGFVVYRDFYDHKPPLILFLSALLPTLFWAKVLISLICSISTYYFYRLARYLLPVTPSRVATIFFLVLTSLPLFEGNIYNAEIINLLLVILAFYYSIVKNKPNLSFFILGLAFTNKFPSIFDTLFLMVFLLSRRPIPGRLVFVVKSGLMFVLPTLIFSFYFALNNSLSQFIKAAFLDNLFYVSSWEPAGPSLVWRLFFLVLITLLLIVIGRRINPQFKYSIWFMSWFFIALFGALLSSRPYPHYLLQIVAPLALVGGLVSTPTKRLLILPLTALAVILAVFNSYGFYRYPNLSYYRAFYTSLLSFKSGQFSTFFGPHVDHIKTLSSQLVTYSPPQSRLLLWGDWPQVYLQTGLVPALPYITSFHVLSLNQQNQVLSTLTANPPPVVVLVNQPYDGLYQFLKKFYRQDMSSDVYSIYRRQ